MKTPSLLLLLCALTGCRTVVIAPESLSCPLPAEELARQCDQPERLAEGITYADFLKAYQADRQRLESCAKQAEYLKKFVNTCNEQIANYNQKLSELKASTQAK